MGRKQGTDIFKSFKEKLLFDLGSKGKYKFERIAETVFLAEEWTH